MKQLKNVSHETMRETRGKTDRGNERKNYR